MPVPARYKAKFDFGCFYHVYNRSVVGISLFQLDRNKDYFLRKFAFYLSPVLHVYSWCLMLNHFHFLIRIKGEDELVLTSVEKDKPTTGTADINAVVTARFKNFFIAYSMAYKKENNISTNVFAQKFKHSHVNKDAYFSQLIYYIHLNPLHHQICSDWQHYP